MVVAIHNHDWKSRNFLGLDERDGLEKFIERTKPARHDHEAVRVLEQKHFSASIISVKRSISLSQFSRAMADPHAQPAKPPADAYWRLCGAEGQALEAFRRVGTR
jgi:hypothetical protein